MYMREKFTTTLSINHKRKLAILAANDETAKNEWIEKMVDIEWRKYINEMADEKNRRR